MYISSLGDKERLLSQAQPSTWRVLVEESCEALGGSSGRKGAAVVAALLQKLPHESVQLRDFHL